MTEFLLRVFVKNREQREDPAVRAAIGRLAGLTGIACNALLFLGKLIAGWAVGSVSIMADAVNNLSDAASSVVTLLGFRLARRPADKDHPYGHARYEYLSGLLVAALILLMGAELVQSSVGKILHPEPMAVSEITYVVLSCSVLVKLWMRGFFRKLGNLIQSTTLHAAAVDSRNDVVATSAVLAGCVISHGFSVNADGYVGLGVAVFILCSGVNLAKETISPLLGQQADAGLVEKITQLVLSHEKVLGIHDLLIHDYGPGQCFASLHAELSAGEDPMACHDIIDQIEQEVLRQLNVHLVIHYDPVAVDDPEREEMRKLLEEIVQGIDPRLSIHDFRILREAGESRLVFDLAVPYAMECSNEELQAAIENVLHARGKPCGTVIRFDGTA